MIERLCVVGVGLIGGSLARALRAAGAVREVVGCGRGRANLERAVALGVVDRFTQDVGEAVSGADLVFLALPLGAMRPALEALRDLMPSEAFDFHHTGLTGPSRYLLVQAESRAMKRWLARPGNRPPGGAPGPARPPS